MNPTPLWPGEPKFPYLPQVQLFGQATHNVLDDIGGGVDAAKVWKNEGS
jgi:hypothetical protein